MKNIEVEDTAMRSFGILCYSRKMSSGELQRHYASLRLGVSLGYIDIPYVSCDEAYIEAQSANIALKCKMEGMANSPEERDTLRSRYLSEKFQRS